MKATDELFQLIKSLSQNEKRYFKLFGARHVAGEENKYMKLFTALDKLKFYDEEAIKRTFGNEKFVKQLSVAKNYLYGLIMKSLSSFNSEKTAVSKISKLIEYAGILSDKNLLKQSKKLLSRAKELAYRHEKFNHILEILHFEKILKIRELHATTYELELDKILEDEKEVAAKINNINEYYNLTSKIYLLSKVADVRSEAELEAFNKIINSPLFSKESEAMSNRALLLYLDGKSIYSRATGDLIKNFEFRKKILKLCEQRPELIEDAPHRKAHSIINYLVSCHMLIKYDEFLPYLEKLKGLIENKDGKKQDIPLLISSFTHEFGFYTATEQFEKAEKLVNDIENRLNTLKESDYSILELYLYFNISKHLFELGKFTDSLKWLNKILNCKYDNDSDVYFIARIVNLAIHFELENFDLLEYTLKSTYNFLYKRKRVYKFEELFLEFIKKTFSIVDKNEINALFEELKYEMLKLENDRFENTVFMEFDIISWLRSKTEHRKFIDILKENRRNIIGKQSYS
jgi:hypothetical protein